MRSRIRNVAAAVLCCMAAMTLLALARAQQQKPLTDGERACLNNMRQVGIALLMYINDYDGKLPPMKSAQQLHNRLVPYSRTRRVFFCPVTHLPYQPERSLSGKSIEEIKDPLKVETTFLIKGKRKKLQDPLSTVVLREPKAHSPKGRCLLFLDSYVAFETSPLRRPQQR